MAVSYNKGKVVYTQNRSYTKTQNDTASLKKQAQVTAETEQNNAGWSGMASGAAAGASIGSVFGPAGAVIGGIVAGGLGGLIGQYGIGANKYKTVMEDFYGTIESNVATNTENARQAQRDRNDLITQSQYFVNSSKANFISTYGKGSFNMLEATITSLLDMNGSTAGIQKASELLGGLQRDSIVGQIETRLMNQDYIVDENGNRVTTGLEREQVEALNSAYVDISDLGSQYVQYLYDSILKADTEIGDQAKALTDSERMQIDQLDDNMKSLALSNQEKFAELFLNQRSQNVSNAQNLGEAEADSGASGIKASKSSRISVNATRLGQDIANASYAILLDSYKKQLEASIASGNLSREQVYFSSRQQMASLKRQVKASINQSINNFVHGSAEYIKSIGEGESNTDEYISAAEADKAFLEGEGRAVDKSTQYIYSTHTATA